MANPRPENENLVKQAFWNFLFGPFDHNQIMREEDLIQEVKKSFNLSEDQFNALVKDIEAFMNAKDHAREEEVAKLKEAISTLEYYERADYKGEWNDVDGGFHARRSLRVINGASEEELKKMDDDRRESW